MFFVKTIKINVSPAGDYVVSMQGKETTKMATLSTHEKSLPKNRVWRLWTKRQGTENLFSLEKYDLLGKIRELFGHEMSEILNDPLSGGKEKVSTIFYFIFSDIFTLHYHSECSRMLR
jgi:hypothetical protein